MPLIMIAVTVSIFSTMFLGIKHGDLPVIRMISASRLLLYIASFIVGAAVFILTRLIFMNVRLSGPEALLKRQISEKKSIILTVAICGIISFLLIHRRFVDEFREYPARDIPYKTFHLLPEGIVLLLIVIVSFVLLFIFQSFENKKPVKILTWIVYIYAGAYVSYSLYSPTLDKHSSFDVFHGTAYIQSIYNALYYMPFDLETTGVYGHYGIIYAAVMRLFRLNSEAVFSLIALAGAVSMICCIYIIHNLVRSDALRIVSAVSLAVPQALVYMTNYWMTYPHKTLFPMLLIAWLVLGFKRERTRKSKYTSWFFLISAYLIAIAGIVWNTETGLYCLICIMAAYIIRDWQKYSWLSPVMPVKYLIHIVFCILSIYGAYGIVSAFNRYCCMKKGIDAAFHLKDFFFPLGIIDSFIGSGTRADVIFGNHAWIYVLILFILSIFYALKHTRILSDDRQNQDPDAPVAASIALMGIMHFALYFSHAAYGKLSMCLLPAVILIAFLCDRDSNILQRFLPSETTIHNIWKRSFTIIGFLTLTVLSAEVLTVGSITLGLHGYLDQGKSDIPHLAALYNSVVPPDTFSIGSCVDVLNYRLHQESGAHYRDLSNLKLGDIDVSDKIVKDALEKDYFAIWMMDNGESKLLSGILDAGTEYLLVREIDLGGYPLRVYSRTDHLP